MSIVIILGNNKVSCVSLTVKDKTVNILEADSRHVDDLSSFLSSADGVKSLLSSCFGGDLKAAAEHKIYFAFTAGSGLAYKTWQAAASSFSDVSDKTFADKEDRILSLCIENVPQGFTDLYKDCVTSVVSCYEDDEVYTVTSAYLPALYINNIKEACETLGLTLFGISDIASSFCKLINCSEQQVLVRANGLTVIVNQFGSLVFMLSGDYSDSIGDIIFNMIEHYYPINNSKMNSQTVSSSDLEPFLLLPFNGLSRYNCEMSVIAAGCVVDSKMLAAGAGNAETVKSNPDKGGSKNSVIGKLRKLFEKK